MIYLVGIVQNGNELLAYNYCYVPLPTLLVRNKLFLWACSLVGAGAGLG